MKRHLTALFLLLFIAAPLHAGVTLETFKFADTAEEERFKELIEELRCLVCQNQSLLDSDAELAHDLRAEVYDMMMQGQGDDEIVGFLVTRYGDFVLYKPPVKPSTYILWFGPLLLLLIAGVLLARAVRRQQQEAEPEISAADRKRLDQLLGDADKEDRET